MEGLVLLANSAACIRSSVRMNAVFLASALILGHALVSAAGPAGAQSEPRPSSVREHDEAVRMARGGDFAAALAVLERLQRDHPADLGIARDHIVVLVWARHDAEAVRLFAALPPGEQPDYLIEEIAESYRRLGQPAEALALFRRGLERSPDNARFAAGEIRSLVDLEQADDAVVRADANLHERGERLDVLLAAAFAVSRQRKPVEALRYLDRAALVAPTNPEVRHDRILAIDEMGAPQVALEMANQEPGLLTPAERRRVEGNAAAALVRWGVFEPPSEAQRFAASDRAIAALDDLIERWSHDGDAARDDILRARFDRMVALRDRVRMADVLDEYHSLLRRDVAIPVYAQVAAADAYLYLREPETARDLYLKALEEDPRNPETRLALFYAHIDLDDFASAYALIDAEVADQPEWIYLKGLNDPVENPARATADLAAANARLYGDELADAHLRLAALAEIAPNNTRFRSALANLYAARGWPRLAAEEYKISLALEPLSVSTGVGQARNNLDLRAYRDTEAQLADLEPRFPENLEVQRLRRLWQVHNMAEFSLNVQAAKRSATNVQGGPGITMDSALYSSPIDYNWRIFGTGSIAHEELPNDEGTITLRRLGAGIEYRRVDLVASLEGSVSTHGPDAGSTLSSGIEGDVGGRAQAVWSVNDNWQIGGGVELFARDTPLRALRDGITANAATASVAYRESESEEISVAGSAMDFSDGNLRTGLAGHYTKRLMTRPRFSIDGILGLAGSRNSADDNRPYFNPSEDALASVGVSINQTIYRRYEFSYDHQLVVTPGVYWQRGYGSDGVGSVFYEQRIRSNDVLELGLGVSFGRQSYDGVPEDSVALLLSVRSRF